MEEEYPRGNNVYFPLIQRTAHRFRLATKDMGINHRRLDILMSE